MEDSSQSREHGMSLLLHRRKITADYDWDSLLRRDGDELETHYRHALEELGKQEGMLGIIFRKAQNKIQDQAKLPPEQ